MKKFITIMVVLILFGGILTGVGCAVYFSGSDSAFGKELVYTEHTYTAEQAFSAVDFDLAFSHRIVFVRGNDYSVRYSDTEECPMTVSAENGTLSLSEHGLSFFRLWGRLLFKHSVAEIEITVPEGAVLSLRGSLAGFSETVLPSWEFGEIDIDLSGAANLSGSGLKTGNVSLDISGAADVALGGELRNVEIEASGATKLSLNGTADTISADASGSVELYLEGSGNSLIVNSSGSSKIAAKGFLLKTASFDASGSIDAEVSVSDTLTVNASGSASVRYWGNPVVNRQTSGTATIRKMD